VCVSSRSEECVCVCVCVGVCVRVVRNEWVTRTLSQFVRGARTHTPIRSGRMSAAAAFFAQSQQQPQQVTASELSELLHISVTSSDNVQLQRVTEAHGRLLARAGYTTGLLTILHQLPLSESSLRQATAIAFKNAIQSGWAPPPMDLNAEVCVDDDGGRLVLDDECTVALVAQSDREPIKAWLVQYWSTPPSAASAAFGESGVEKQLLECIRLIALHDFPGRWPELRTLLVGSLVPPPPSQQQQQQQQQQQPVLEALKLLHELCARYRTARRCDALWREIRVVLREVTGPLFQLLTHLSEAVLQGKPPLHPTLAAWSSSQFLDALVFCGELVVDLNGQDLAAEFEENEQARLRQWFQVACQLLSFNQTGSPFAEPAEESARANQHGTPTPWDRLRATICHGLSWFLNRYEDDCQPHAGMCAQAIWTVLQDDRACSQQSRHDAMVTSALQVLESLMRNASLRSQFAADGVLANILQKTALPQLLTRASEVEMYENDPQQYIQLDFDGQQAGTRRRACLAVIQAMLGSFPHESRAMITNGVQGSVAQTPAQFASLRVTFALEVALNLRNGSLADGMQLLTQRLFTVFQQVHSTGTIGAQAQAQDPGVRRLIRADFLAVLARLHVTSSTVNALQREPLLRQTVQLLNACSGVLRDEVSDGGQDVVCIHYAVAAMDRVLWIATLANQRLDEACAEGAFDALWDVATRLMHRESDLHHAFPNGHDLIFQALRRLMALASDSWRDPSQARHDNRCLAAAILLEMLTSRLGESDWHIECLRQFFSWLLAVLPAQAERQTTPAVAAFPSTAMQATGSEDGFRRLLRAVGTAMAAVHADAAVRVLPLELYVYLYQFCSALVQRCAMRMVRDPDTMAPLWAEWLLHLVAVTPETLLHSPLWSRPKAAEAAMQLLESCFRSFVAHTHSQSPLGQLVQQKCDETVQTLVASASSGAAPALARLDLLRPFLCFNYTESPPPTPVALFLLRNCVFPCIQQAQCPSAYIARVFVAILAWIAKAGLADVTRSLDAMQSGVLSQWLFRQVLLPHNARVAAVRQRLQAAQDLALYQASIAAVLAWLEQETHLVDAAWVAACDLSVVLLTDSTRTFTATGASASSGAMQLYDTANVETLRSRAGLATAWQQSQLARLHQLLSRADIACKVPPNLRAQLGRFSELQQSS
jgi:hypothetical protein